MKVEYSYHKDAPCMAAKGVAFLKAPKDGDERFLL